VPEQPSPEKHAFLLRLPPALFARVRTLAEREMRSVNAQIEFLLAEAVRRRAGGPPPGRRPEAGTGGAPGSGAPGEPVG
jgi:hypothetical protein